jgi:aryl carrier-like protein
MTDGHGNQLTYRQIAERMTLQPWVRLECQAPVPAPERPARAA